MWMRAAMALCIIALPLSAVAETIAGSGRAVTEERSVSGFHGIAVSVPGRVELVQGADEGMTLTADDNVLARIITNVDRGVLRVRFPRGVSVRARTPIHLVVRARTVDSISIAGAARLEARKLEGDRIAVELAGSASALLPAVAARELVLGTSGHCHAMLGGKTERFVLKIAGAGEINAARLEAQQATVRIAGSAQVAAWVLRSLEARVTGSGAVRYFGDPRIERRVVGSGVVERLGASPP